MKRRTPRGLDPEERSLWQRVAQTTTPLKRARLNSGTAPEPAIEVKSARKDRQVIAPFAIGARSDTALPKSDMGNRSIPLSGTAQVHMDRKAFQKMKRGKSVPEAKLDLHGMNVAAAHGALTAFIFSAQGKGKRLVLVITGKGRITDDAGPIPTRPGILRRHVPQWLGQPPLSLAVLQVSQAHQRHGGSGALYVYLRRR